MIRLTTTHTHNRHRINISSIRTFTIQPMTRLRHTTPKSNTKRTIISSLSQNSTKRRPITQLNRPHSTTINLFNPMQRTNRLNRLINLITRTKTRTTTIHFLRHSSIMITRRTNSNLRVTNLQNIQRRNLPTANSPLHQVINTNTNLSIRTRRLRTPPQVNSLIKQHIPQRNPNYNPNQNTTYTPQH